jgi:hypothetical protein
VRTALIAAVIAGGTVIAASYAAGGARGAGLAGVVIAIAALLAGRALLPRAARRPEVRLAGPLRLRRERRMMAGAEFTGYREVIGDLGWAPVSRRHYDYITRRRLFRLLRGLAAERRGLDADHEPAAARALAGEDLWPLLDPARPACEDTGVPGVDLATLGRIIDRLEEL